MSESLSKNVSAAQIIKNKDTGSSDPIQYFSSRHWKRTYAHAHSIAHNSADAEDIAQETYIKLFQTFLAGRKIDSCMAWIKGVVRKVVVDQFRKARPDLYASVDDIFDDTESGRRNTLAHLADSSSSIEDRLIHQSLVHESLRVLAELPERDRECVLMYARGYKFVQIASALGIPYETAIATTRRAFERTRRGIEKAGCWNESRRKAECLTAADRDAKGNVNKGQALLIQAEANIRPSVRALCQIGDVYSFGDVVVNVTSRRLSRGGAVVRVSSKEFELLRYFLNHAGETLTRGRLLQEVWGYHHSWTMRTLDTHVARLRQKVEINPGQPRFIVTVRGVGYRFLPGGQP
jgi:RNA polymerase sigma factor (sigma-70 family)